MNDYNKLVINNLPNTLWLKGYPLYEIGTLIEEYTHKVEFDNSAKDNSTSFRIFLKFPSPIFNYNKKKILNYTTTIKDLVKYDLSKIYDATNPSIHVADSDSTMSFKYNENFMFEAFIYDTKIVDEETTPIIVLHGVGYRTVHEKSRKFLETDNDTVIPTKTLSVPLANRPNAVNLNGNFYSEKTWFNALKRINELVANKTLFGTIGHPFYPENADITPEVLSSPLHGDFRIESIENDLATILPMSDVTYDRIADLINKEQASLCYKGIGRIQDNEITDLTITSFALIPARK